MKKFSELEYIHPDGVKLIGDIEELTKHLARSVSYEDAAACCREFEAKMDQFQTTSSIADVRGSMAKSLR